MNYAILDIHGHIVMEFHTEDEAMRYSRSLISSTKDPLSVYKKIADMKYSEVLETTVYGN